MAQKLPAVTGPQLRQLIRVDYAMAIGHVIAQWSALEGMIEAACWQAARLRNDLGRVITSQLQMQSKMDLLGALLMQTRPILGEQFNRVADYIRDCLLGQRNLVAHGFWIMELGLSHAAVVKFRTKGELVAQGRTIPLTELITLADDIADVTAWVIALAGMLPKLKQRPGGLGHKTPAPLNHQACATRKTRALRLPIVRQRAPKKGRPGSQHRRR